MSERMTEAKQRLAEAKQRLAEAKQRLAEAKQRMTEAKETAKSERREEAKAEATEAKAEATEAKARATEAGPLLRLARLEAGKTQQVMAVAMGMSKQTVSAYELGHTPMTTEKLREWAAITGKPVSFFFEGAA